MGAWGRKSGGITCCLHLILRILFLVACQRFHRVNAGGLGLGGLVVGGEYPPLYGKPVEPPSDVCPAPDLPPPPPEEVCPAPDLPPPPPQEVCPLPPPPPPPKSPNPPKPPNPPQPPNPSPPPPKPPNPPKQSDYTPPIELQRALKVIQQFKKTITYDPLNITDTWVGNKICIDEYTYKGFICDSKSDNKNRVALVKFNGYNFDGKPLLLANFLDRLTDLIVFHVNSNNFTGEILAGISNIPSLYELDLSNNELKGEFPKYVLKATQLTFLDLRYNKLTGKLPPDVFNMDLDVLFLNNNQFVGQIPEEIGNTTVLYLTLANNMLDGPIPKSIGRTADTLLEILLLKNHLSGCLPYEIGNLKKATVFDASENHLTGPIPQSFACLESVQYLNMSYNHLYGAVPESVCRLSDLLELTLQSNYFTQVGPLCRKLIKNKVLNVDMNCILDLPSQRSPKDCEDFFLKRNSCPDPKSLNYVPCNIPISGPHEISRVNRRLLGRPRTYEALQRPQP